MGVVSRRPPARQPGAVDAIYQRLKADGFDIKAPMSSTEAGHRSYNIEHLTCDARADLIWRPTAAQAGDSSSGSAAQKVVTRKECRGLPRQVEAWPANARQPLGTTIFSRPF
jgi:hypothetical protein